MRHHANSIRIHFGGLVLHVYHYLILLPFSSTVVLAKIKKDFENFEFSGFRF